MKSWVRVSAASGAPVLAAALGGGMVPARPELIPGLIMSPAANFGLSPEENPAVGIMDGSRLDVYGATPAALKAAVMGPGWVFDAEASGHSFEASASRVGVGKRSVGEAVESHGVEEKFRLRAVEGDSGGGSMVWEWVGRCGLGR